MSVLLISIALRRLAFSYSACTCLFICLFFNYYYLGFAQQRTDPKSADTDARKFTQ